jgi:hypothetical protein
MLPIRRLKLERAVMPTFTPRIWLGLGASALLQAAVAADAAAQPVAAPPAAAPPGIQGGEGGEGGEGGIDAGRAATDPVAYLAALDVLAAHVIAGRDAYAAGEPQAAAEMFAHGVAEVYVEMAPLFEARRVAPFRETLERATTLALDRAPAAEVSGTAAAVLAALREAEAKAPGGLPPVAAQAAAIVEMLGRAALQHAIAARDPQALEPYLDGYGLLLAARTRAGAALPAIEARSRPAAEAIRASMASLARAYPTATRPPATAPAVDAGALLAEASRAKLAAGDLE